jgi:hypothetical protein
MKCKCLSEEVHEQLMDKVKLFKCSLLLSADSFNFILRETHHIVAPMVHGASAHHAVSIPTTLYLYTIVMADHLSPQPWVILRSIQSPRFC